MLFPPQCPCCRREVGESAEGGGLAESAGRREPESAICVSCARELAADVARCGRCGAPSDAADCRECSRRPRAWGRVAVLSAYAGGLREAVLRAKRPAGVDAAAALAGLLIRKHVATLQGWGSNVVVPVPMHWVRRSFRGGSAADEIAAVMARRLGVPWSRDVARSRATRMQNELPIEDRPRNVAGAFRARRRLDGCRVLLVDDVMTTGATLEACARVLLKAGARAVDVAVVARADSPGSRGDG